MRLIGLGLVLLCTSSALALDGATPLEFTPLAIPGNDWRIRELYTASDNVAAIADPGYVAKTTFDGMGAFAINSSTVRVVFNHELSSPNATISYLDLNKSAVQSWIAAGTTAAPTQAVTRIGKAYDSIVGSTSLGRFCSSTLMEANRFGAGIGMASRTYLTGEEVAGGSFYAIDCDTTSATYRTLFECTALPTAPWEQALEHRPNRQSRAAAPGRQRLEHHHRHVAAAHLDRQQA